MENNSFTSIIVQKSVPDLITINHELFWQKREEKIPSEISLTWDLSTIQFLTLGQETALLVGTTSSN